MSASQQRFTLNQILYTATMNCTDMKNMQGLIVFYFLKTYITGVASCASVACILKKKGYRLIGVVGSIHN
jgi:hypothetical protein